MCGLQRLEFFLLLVSTERNHGVTSLTCQSLDPQQEQTLPALWSVFFFFFNLLNYSCFTTC